MLERFKRPARVIPRRDDNGAVKILCAQQFDGELRVLRGRFRFGLDLDDICRNPLLDQNTSVDSIVAGAADDNARRGLLFEKFGCLFGPFARAGSAAQNNYCVGFCRPAVNAEKLLRKSHRHNRQRGK